jgi:tetratricopeptide (TPR) repeat protein
LARGRQDELRESIARARELGCPPESLAVLGALIDARGGRYAQAEPILRRAFNEDRETDPLLDEILARLYLETYELSRAELVLARWARQAPQDPRPYLWRAEIHVRKNSSDPGDIIRDYRQALKRDPGLIVPRRSLAEHLQRARRYAEAAAHYEEYLALRPDDPVAHVGAGRNALEMGDEAAAARHLQRALALDPSAAEAHKDLARIDMSHGREADALAHLDRASELDPTDIEIRYTRSLVLTCLGREREGRAEHAEAARLRAELGELSDAQGRLVGNPGDLDAQLRITQWLFSHGKTREGRRWAEKILRERPGQPEASRLLADSYDRSGQAGLANFYRAQAESGGRVSAR